MAVKKNADGKTTTVTTGGNLPGQGSAAIAPRKNPLAVPFPKSSDPLPAAKKQTRVPRNQR